MRQTLFFVPHAVAGVPMFGVGWLLIGWLVITAGIVHRQWKHHGAAEAARLGTRSDPAGRRKTGADASGGVWLSAAGSDIFHGRPGGSSSGTS